MKRILATLFTIVILLSSFLLYGCSQQEIKDEGKIKIVATLFPQYDFARAIAGDKANIELLLPPGTDSHSFDPSMQDVLKISDADLFIYTGDDMEPWSKSFAENAGSECTILNVSERIELKGIAHEGESGDSHENVDPHIWTSPANAVIIAEEIRDALCMVDTANESYYKENAESYISELKELDKDYREVAEKANGKKLYFGGEFAFLYLVKEYGFEYMSLYDSCSEHAEPSAKKIDDMISEMKENEASTIFYPELSEPAAAMTIFKETGAKPVMLHSCHNLTEEEFKEGKTYLSIMKENLVKIEEALS